MVKILSTVFWLWIAAALLLNIVRMI